MYENFKSRLEEHIEEFGSTIPYEPSIAETYLIYSILLRLEELEDEYDDLLEHVHECHFCSMNRKGDCCE